MKMRISKVNNPSDIKSNIYKNNIIESAINKNSAQAEEMLQDKGKLDRFLENLEDKLKTIPGIGNKLSEVATLASMVKDFASGDYPDIPAGTAVAALASLIYVVSPIDIIPDAIPGLGIIDDAAVIAVCTKLIESDLEDYKEWRGDNEVEIEK